MNRFYLLFLALVLACHTNNTQKELVVLDNKDSEEITFILELNTKENSPEDVESFTQYLLILLLRESLPLFMDITFRRMVKK